MQYQQNQRCKYQNQRGTPANRVVCNEVFKKKTGVIGSFMKLLYGTGCWVITATLCLLTEFRSHNIVVVIVKVMCWWSWLLCALCLIQQQTGRLYDTRQVKIEVHEPFIHYISSPCIILSHPNSKHVYIYVGLACSFHPPPCWGLWSPLGTVELTQTRTLRSWSSKANDGGYAVGWEYAVSVKTLRWRSDISGLITSN